jgi:protein-L-isoaspartate(D-aspartate) O-methyltransferase
MFYKTGFDLINEIKDLGVLRTPKIVKAIEEIDRKDFVRAEDKNGAYENVPLSIGFGQTISQPLTVAFMLELLEVEEGNKVLDVGAGSGWTTALLAKLVGEKEKVYATEVISELLGFGSENLSKYFKKDRAEIFLAGSILGLPEQAPFDRILVSAAGDKIPETLVEQLKAGGIMVLPVSNSIKRVIKGKVEKELVIEEYPGFVFVRLKE